MEDLRGTDGNEHFQNIADFEDCMIRGGEVCFCWKSVEYGISYTATQILIYQWDSPEPAQYFETPDDALDFRLVSGERLRDVLTQVEVVERML